MVPFIMADHIFTNPCLHVRPNRFEQLPFLLIQWSEKIIALFAKHGQSVLEKV